MSRYFEWCLLLACALVPALGHARADECVSTGSDLTDPNSPKTISTSTERAPFCDVQFQSTNSMVGAAWLKRDLEASYNAGWKITAELSADRISGWAETPFLSIDVRSEEGAKQVLRIGRSPSLAYDPQPPDHLLAVWPDSSPDSSRSISLRFPLEHGAEHAYLLEIALRRDPQQLLTWLGLCFEGQVQWVPIAARPSDQFRIQFGTLAASDPSELAQLNSLYYGRHFSLLHTLRPGTTQSVCGVAPPAPDASIRP
ncbi:hypothetical protein [Pseudomarimonas arenosa]|uniref:Uncharacterized protein n=1 Tax=Pseudomarimonas arenosa TaxID=2774145 RepID=A0AAW3ZJH7_9GAMM|nr:hypothetical protein [Pseudomarimonas arenosa]MBD8525085.1 hypothetical protein [Pseudomarimonas arenosa]